MSFSFHNTDPLYIEHQPTRVSDSRDAQTFDGVEVNAVRDFAEATRKHASGWMNAKTFGCACNGATDDTENLRDALAAASAAQTELVLPGMCRFTEDIIVPQNVTIRGVGPKFGAGFRPDGASLLIRGADQVGGYSFRKYFRDLMVWPLAAPASGKIIEIDSAYSVHFSETWFYEVPASTTAIYANETADLVLSNVVIYGKDNVSSRGVHLNGATHAKIIAPDFELLNAALVCEGHAKADVFSPYMERNIVGIDVFGSTSGRVRVFGGYIVGGNASQMCIRAISGNLFVLWTSLAADVGGNRFYAFPGAKVVWWDDSTSRLFSGAVTVEGNIAPTEAITLPGGDLSAENGVVLTSPDGSRHRVVVANDGTLSTAAP